MAIKILLIQPPSLTHSDFFNDGGRCQPLGLAYLAASLIKFDFPVNIVDCDVLGYSIGKMLQIVKKQRPDVVGISSVTSNFTNALKIAKNLKKLKIPPIIILGGAHVTAVPQTIKDYPYFDFAVLGEGEVSTIEILQNINKYNKNFSKIDGIAYLKGKKLVITHPRTYIHNLDSLPFPQRELLPPLSLYQPSPGMYRQRPLATMITSRGCPFRCLFCFRAVFGNLYRARSANNVVDEMEVLVKKFGVREIRMLDDTFNYNNQRVIAICKEIIKRKLSIPWSCLARVNFMNEEVLTWMKQAGCWQIAYGIESGNQEVLTTISKGLTKEMVKNTVKLTKKAGIEARGFFMLGLPGDSRETMQETIDFAKELDLTLANFFITMPFPGTELTKTAYKYGKLTNVSYENFLIQTAKSPPFLPFGLSAKILKQYFSKAYREFYLRPSFILKRLFAIHSLAQLKNYVSALFTIIKIAQSK